MPSRRETFHRVHFFDVFSPSYFIDVDYSAVKRGEKKVNLHKNHVICQAG